MARNVRELLHADVGVAVTGVAGPGGATPGKPVGLVYVAMAAQDGGWAEQHTWLGNRWENKARTADAALDLLRRYLAGCL
jgi:nicotinamide mononucleotide (NMN) deamidase PncC